MKKRSLLLPLLMVVILTLAFPFIALATTSDLPATLPASTAITTDSLPVIAGPGTPGIDAAPLVMVAGYESATDVASTTPAVTGITDTAVSVENTAALTATPFGTGIGFLTGLPFAKYVATTDGGIIPTGLVIENAKDTTATLTAASPYTTLWTFAGVAVAAIIAVLALYLTRERLVHALRTITDDGLRLRHKDGWRRRHPGVKWALA